MRPCLKAKEISQNVKMNLPVINDRTYHKHFCWECPYYAGKISGIPHCMQQKCAWDDERERFSPELRKMLPIIRTELREAQAQYLEAQRKYETIKSMFAEEDEEERRKKDPCFRCSFRTCGPCIGYCYRQMTANPVEEYFRREIHA